MKDMAMKKAAMDMLSKLQELDINKAKAVSVSVMMDDSGMPEGRMHRMPDGSMMKDEDMEDEEYGMDKEESSGEYCKDCGDKMKGDRCSSCGYKMKKGMDE